MKKLFCKIKKEMESPPEIINRSTDDLMVHREGDPVTLSVEVKGTPNPKVTWLLGKRPLITSMDYMTKSRGKIHNLYISRVGQEVNDGLSVEAKNTVGSDHLPINLKVYSLLLNKNVTVQCSDTKNKTENGQPFKKSSNLTRYKTMPLNRVINSKYWQLRSLPKRSASAASDQPHHINYNVPRSHSNISRPNTVHIPHSASRQSCSTASTVDSGYDENSIAPSTPSTSRIDEIDEIQLNAATDSSSSSPVLLPPLAVAEDDSLSLSSIEEDDSKSCSPVLQPAHYSTIQDKGNIKSTTTLDKSQDDIIPVQVNVQESCPIPIEYKESMPIEPQIVPTKQNIQESCTVVHPIKNNSNPNDKSTENKNFEIKESSQSAKPSSIINQPENDVIFVAPLVDEQGKECIPEPRNLQDGKSKDGQKNKDKNKESDKDVIQKSHSHEKPRIFNFFKHRDHKKHEDHVSNNGHMKTPQAKPSDENDSISSDSSKKGTHRKSSWSFIDRTRMAFHNIRSPNDKDHHGRTPTETDEQLVATFMGRHPAEEESDQRRSKRINNKSIEDKDVQNVTGVGFLGPKQVTNKSNRHGLTLANLKKRFKWGKHTPEKHLQIEPVSPPWAQQYVEDIKEENTIIPTSNKQNEDDDEVLPSFDSMTRSPAINNFEEAIKQDFTISRLNGHTKKNRVRFNEIQLETTNYYYVSDSDISATSVDTLTAEESGLRDQTDLDFKNTVSTRQRTLLKSLGKSIGGVGYDGEGDEYFLNKGITDDGCMFSFWSNKKSATSSPRLFRKPYPFNLAESNNHEISDNNPAIENESSIFYGNTNNKPNLKPLFTQNNCPVNYNSKPIIDKEANCDSENRKCDKSKLRLNDMTKPEEKIANPAAHILVCDTSETTSSESINDSGYFHGSFDYEGSEANKLHGKTRNASDSLKDATECKTDNSFINGVGGITACYETKLSSEPTHSPKRLYTKQLHYVSNDDTTDVCDHELKPELRYIGDEDQKACTEESIIESKLDEQCCTTKTVNELSGKEVGKVTSTIIEQSLVDKPASLTSPEIPKSLYKEDSATDSSDSDNSNVADHACAISLTDDEESDDSSTLMMSDNSCMLKKSCSSDSVQETILPTFQEHICSSNAPLNLIKTTPTKTRYLQRQNDLSDSAVESNNDSLDSSDIESGSSLENCNNSNSNESLLDIDNETEEIAFTNSSLETNNFSINNSYSSHGNLSDISERTQESSLEDNCNEEEDKHSKDISKKPKTNRKKWKKILAGSVGVIIAVILSIAAIHLMEHLQIELPSLDSITK